MSYPAGSYTGASANDDFLVGGALTRRCLGWIFDVFLITVLVVVLWTVLVMFGLLTFGLGFGAMGVLPFVPFLYHVLSLMGASSATPGQQMLGLTVRRDFDLGPPSLLQAVVSVVAFYLTLGFSGGVLLLVALFTTRHRTLHDLLSGLVVVRVDAMRSLTAPRSGRPLTEPGSGWNMGGTHDL
jgi:uncharacterized RDD family membrane protein YckC